MLAQGFEVAVLAVDGLLYLVRAAEERYAPGTAVDEAVRGFLCRRCIVDYY